MISSRPRLRQTAPISRSQSCFSLKPPQVVTLLHISLLRSLGSDCKLTKIVGQSDSVRLYPESFQLKAWSELAAKYNGKLLISLGNTPYVTLKPGKNKPIPLLERMLTDYLQIILAQNA